MIFGRSAALDESSTIRAGAAVGAAPLRIDGRAVPVTVSVGCVEVDVAPDVALRRLEQAVVGLQARGGNAVTT